MPTNTKIYMKEYMKLYNEKNGYVVECPICGVEIKKYNMYSHKRTKTHKLIERKLKELHADPAPANIIAQ